jgi:hypothetical protein
MSDTCFIFPADTKLWEDPNDTSEKPKSDLRIDRNLFRLKLKERFPYLRDGGYRGEFDLNNENEEGVGIWVSTVEGDYETAYIKPQGVNLYKFVLWYREFVPEKYPLYFNCFSHSFDGLELTSSTTIDDIKAFLGRS